MTIALTITWNNEPAFPTTIDPIPTIILITDTIKVIAQAQLNPFHSPYATAKYANPIMMRIPPSIIPSIGTIAKIVNPLNNEPIPPRTASIAIIVTPKGLFLCIQ